MIINLGLFLFALLINITGVIQIFSWTIIGCSLKPLKTNENLKINSDSRSTTFLKYAAYSVYYVGGKNASDENRGTKDAPFATISRAASILKEGDTCYIRAGIYRETVAPKNSGSPGKPIVFTSDGGVDVTISGADKANGGWTVYRGNIYQKTIALPVTGYIDEITGNTSLLANQVFVDGKMMIEARWPNISNSDDLMNRADFALVPKDGWKSDEGTTLRDPDIPDIPGGWTGGTIWMIGWYVPGTSTISSSSAGQIKFPLTRHDEFHDSYYLTGRLGALDTRKEWFYDGTTLYMWAPDDGIPANAEVKMRNYAFDLSDKSFITISNISIFAATITTNSNSTNIILDRLKFQYISHFVTLPPVPEEYLKRYSLTNAVTHSHHHDSGVRLMGANSVIQNSIIEYSAGHGIILGATGCIAKNNLVHDISYGGTYAGGIIPSRCDAPQAITHNTIYRTGRAGIDGIGSNKDIGYNDIYDFGLINTDLGAIYSANDLNLSGTRIHHNWFHDAKNDNNHRYPVGAGIYLDQNARPAQIDHNVFWNNNKNDIRVQQDSAPYDMIYNNTMASNPPDFWASFHSERSSCPGNSKNNIYCSSLYPDTPGSNEITSETDPLFVNPNAGGLGFRLQPGSPAIDHGQVINGVTDGYQGNAPDAGAYEFNGQDWKAGVLSKPGPVMSKTVH
jgi:hemerythrin